jgi:hypothetical protein
LDGINVFRPQEFFIEVMDFLNKFGLALDGTATHASVELVKIDIQFNRNVRQAFLSRGNEQEFAKTFFFFETYA